MIPIIMQIPASCGGVLVAFLGCDFAIIPSAEIGFLFLVVGIISVRSRLSSRAFVWATLVSMLFIPLYATVNGGLLYALGISGIMAVITIGMFAYESRKHSN